MTALVVIGCIATYLMVGAFYARSQALACYRRASGWGSEDSRRDSVILQMAWRVFAWPYAVPLDLVRGDVRAWFLHPLDSRRDRAKQLRADAQAWREKQYNGTATERQMAAELARLCDEQAREVDL